MKLGPDYRVIMYWMYSMGCTMYYKLRVLFFFPVQRVAWTCLQLFIERLVHFTHCWFDFLFLSSWLQTWVGQTTAVSRCGNGGILTSSTPTGSLDSILKSPRCTSMTKAIRYMFIKRLHKSPFHPVSFIPHGIQLRGRLKEFLTSRLPPHIFTMRPYSPVFRLHVPRQSRGVTAFTYSGVGLAHARAFARAFSWLPTYCYWGPRSFFAPLKPL